MNYQLLWKSGEGTFTYINCCIGCTYQYSIYAFSLFVSEKNLKILFTCGTFPVYCSTYYSFFLSEKKGESSASNPKDQTATSETASQSQKISLPSFIQESDSSTKVPYKYVNTPI